MTKTPRATARLRTTSALLAAVGLLAAGAVSAPAAAGAPDAAAGNLTAQYHAGTTGSEQAEPWLKLTNTGDTSVPLSGLTIRYYFKADAGAPGYRFACSWAVRGCANVTGTFGSLAAPTATADRYLEIGFTAGAGSLAPGANSGDLQLRFHRTDWQPLNQSDDYSFGAAQTAYADWSKVTVQRGGTLLWGTAPEGNDPGDPGDPPDPNGPALFDDFDYTGHTDARLGQRGWTVRSGGGGPGAPGVGWAPEQVTFPGDGAAAVLNLRTSTDGTAAGTRQTELYHQRKFQQGTYAARVRFSDAPVSGPDGDQMVQTFFTITPLDAPMDPDYGELDFEYLPNGGWGESSHILYATSWETYRPDPWEAVNTHTAARQSYAGWHDLVITVDGDSIDYYVDGQPFAVHGEPYLPETPMSINLNHWIISGGLAGSTTPRAYDQQVDYVYFAKDQTLTPAQVAEQVAAYRAGGVSHQDTVPGG
ncbi:cellulose binding domain-containing protein [Streptomyces sp. 184]|uniref:cellulose binding domain-containing protein n=1 Tax=Streptomyces sp. 184 TaxID=1827526 RepID=UPI003891C99D